MNGSQFTPPVLGQVPSDWHARCFVVKNDGFMQTCLQSKGSPVAVQRQCGEGGEWVGVQRTQFRPCSAPNPAVQSDGVGGEGGGGENMHCNPIAGRTVR